MKDLPALHPVKIDVWPPSSHRDIESWLREERPERLELLWARADQVRREAVGDEVHFRGLIEISNFCSRSCHYCGLRAERLGLTRYRMTDEEIMACVRQAVEFGYGTVVLQAGEDPGLRPQRIAELVRRIKAESPLAVTLSLGEQNDETFRLWREAGADRYLLRIETTDDALLKRIHPGEPHGARKESLARLKKYGYEVGSGIMVGIPGQTMAMVAADLKWFARTDLDMIGIGPYLAHPETPLARVREHPLDQVPNTELMANKVVALARILCPHAHLPATTALATVNRENGREQALAHGANVVMPNLTPIKYRAWYEIYPAKACIHETGDVCYACLQDRIVRLGRKIGQGPGGKVKG